MTKRLNVPKLIGNDSFYENPHGGASKKPPKLRTNNSGPACIENWLNFLAEPVLKLVCRIS